MGVFVPSVYPMAEHATPISAQQLKDFGELVAARTAWGRGDLDTALSMFAKATALRPTNVKALLEAARAFGGRHEIAAAERYLDQATEIAGSDPRVAPAIAQSYARIFRPERAIEAYEHIADLPPPMQGELATLYEQVGRLDEALAAIDACIALAPNAPEPKLVRGRILRRLRRFDDALEMLQPIAASNGHPVLRAEASTEICYIHDAAGEYERAIEAIDLAHTLVRALPQAPVLFQKAAANNTALSSLAASVSQDRLQAWAQRETRPLPRVGGIAHLIGFPRSGTTLLEQCLDAHPRIVASPERLVFSRDIFPKLCKAGGGPLTLETLDSSPTHVLDTERERYLDFMEQTLGAPMGDRIHIDKNPNHTSLLPGLLRLFPESKFIVALRDPRDVVTSCVLRTFRLTEFSSMLTSWSTACELYAVEMGAWLRYRAALQDGQWVEVRYEDTVADFERESRRAIDGLELPWDDVVLEYRERTRHKLVNSPTQTEVRQPIYTSAIGRWQHYRKHLEPHMHVLQPFIDTFGYE